MDDAKFNQQEQQVETQINVAGDIHLHTPAAGAMTGAAPPPSENHGRATVGVLRIVVASPGDVQPERDALDRVRDELNNGLARHFNLVIQFDRWEKRTHPGMHRDGPQGLADAALQIPDCDILLGILWKRFGTPVKDAGSGTEHEFNLAYAAWQEKETPDVWFYFKKKPFFPTGQETEQLAKVLHFQENFPKEGLYWTFQETNEFVDLVRQHLTQYITETAQKKTPLNPPPP